MRKQNTRTSDDRQMRGANYRNNFATAAFFYPSELDTTCIAPPGKKEKKKKKKTRQREHNNQQPPINESMNQKLIRGHSLGCVN